MMCIRSWDVMKWFLIGALLSCLGGIGTTLFMHYVIGPY